MSIAPPGDEPHTAPPASGLPGESGAVSPTSATAANAPSARLYNDDLAPVERGGALLFARMHAKAPMSRIAFGINGGQVAAVIRGSVAIVWFGIQTYLAAVVLRVMLIALWPALGSLDHDSILGLSTLGWLAFAAFWIVQVVIVSYGMAMVRRYVALAGPVILLAMVAIAGWVFIRAGAAISLSTDQVLTGSAMWGKIFAGAALWVVIYGTFALNVCDFTRCVTSRRAIVLGNLVGIPLNMMVFAVIVIVLAGAQYHIDGQIMTSPADIVQTIPNTLFLVLACLALIVLTVAVNLVANFVAPIYMLADRSQRFHDVDGAAIAWQSR